MSHIEILSPDELKANYQGPDESGEYPAYTRADWQKVVALGLTIDGYWTWVHNSLCDEVAEADAEEDMDVSQVSYANKGTCTPIDEPNQRSRRQSHDPGRQRSHEWRIRHRGTTATSTTPASALETPGTHRKARPYCA